jgi:hypothetical protein
VETHDVKQYSDEWWALRRGRLTSSQADTLLTPTGKISTQYKATLCRNLAMMLGWQEQDQDNFSTQWTERGSALEAEALSWLAVDQDINGDRVGFVTCESVYNGLVGTSPDAIYRNESGDWCPIEIKCPMPATHIKYLLEGDLPKEYQAQVHFHMAVMGSPEAVFMSYSPDCEPLIIRVAADSKTDAMLAALGVYVDEFKAAHLRVTGRPYQSI